MEEILKRYPVPKKEKIIISNHPEYTLDLHGNTQYSSLLKLDWFFEISAYREYFCIQIITGKGKGILHKSTQKYLNTNKEKLSIKKWTWKDENTRVIVFL